MKYSLALFVLLTLSFLASPSYVTAHAELVDADPSPGAQLASSPTEIRLTFSEPLQPGSTFTLLAPGFREVAGFQVEIDPQFNEQLFAILPPLDPGAYTVQWTAVTEDGGKTSGSYTFLVAQSGGLEIWWVAAAASVVLLMVGAFIWRRKGIEIQGTVTKTLLAAGFALVGIGIGMVGIFIVRQWNLTRRSPEARALDYVRVVYARDYPLAWEFISTKDKQIKTRQAYLAENTSFTGLKRDLSYTLAGWIQFTQVMTEVVGERANVAVHVIAPNGNQKEVYAILENAEGRTNFRILSSELFSHKWRVFMKQAR